MDTVENDLWDVYRHLLSKGASPETAREAILALARDRLPQADDYVVRETAARVIAFFRTRSRGSGMGAGTDAPQAQKKPDTPLDPKNEPGAA